jgi:hypothetical protein
MAGSSTLGSTGRNPFGMSLLTPGPLGCRDGADPSLGLVPAHSPGAVGLNDCADPKARSPYGLGIGTLHLTLSIDRDLRFWDYDPDRLLEDVRLNPEFVELAHQGLKTAVALGLRPRVHEAYRSATKSDTMHAKYVAHKNDAGTNKPGKAAPGWESVHNYGLAMDVWLYDARGKYIDNHVQGWYALYNKLAKALKDFLWGASFDDADHWEYHPKWVKPAKGKHLKAARLWALRAAADKPDKVAMDAVAPEASRSIGAQDFISEADLNWVPYFWWVVGAKTDREPNSAFAATNTPPVQG